MSGAEFRPVLWLPGRHLETIVPSLWPAGRVPGVSETRVVAVAPESAVRLEVTRPEGPARGTLLLVHGMGGSSESGYMRRTARLACARGFVAVRMNLRNCGGTEALSKTLYNAGQCDDAAGVLDALDADGLPRPFAAAGFSLGGNLLLLHAGRAGASCAADTVVAVSPPIDLDACLRALERPENRLYHFHFLRGLCRQIRRIRRIRPVPGPAASVLRIGSVRKFDGLFTAPDAGYLTAEEYYAAASAGPHLPAITVPSLILSSSNDPFVPASMFETAGRARAPRVRIEVPARGGHVGYWQSGSPRFFAGDAIVSALEAIA